MNLSQEQKKILIAQAIKVRLNAYAPYSNFAVGAAVLADNGEIYDGANVENAAYPTTMCAERAAIFKAVSDGERSMQALAVVTQKAGYPCGACRQVLSEFSQEAIIIVANDSGEILHETTLADLLPHSFGPEDLGKELESDTHG